MGLKKTDSISLKTQHFLYTNFSSIKDHNQTKQPFQTRILYKKRYYKPPNKYPYTYPYKNPYKQFHTLISSSSSSSSSSLLFFSSLLYSLNRFALTCKTKMRYFAFIFSLLNVRPEKFQFLEKWQNRKFGYKIVISIKNPKFIL